MQGHGGKNQDDSISGLDRAGKRQAGKGRNRMSCLRARNNAPDESCHQVQNDNTASRVVVQAERMSRVNVMRAAINERDDRYFSP